MPSKRRQFYQFGVYHIYNRGNHRQPIFHSDWDYQYFLKVTTHNAEKFEIKILAYCLMRNHVHFAVQQLGGESDSPSKWIGNSTMSYVHYYNKRYETVGRIFQAPFKARLISNDEDLTNLIEYIHNNPAEFIQPSLYPWSSCSHKLSVLRRADPRLAVANQP